MCTNYNVANIGRARGGIAVRCVVRCVVSPLSDISAPTAHTTVAGTLDSAVPPVLVLAYLLIEH